MARRKRKASPADIAEVASGRGSASDKREMGFVKQGRKLVPGKHTPRKLKTKFGTRARQTKRRIRRKRGRGRN